MKQKDIRPKVSDDDVRHILREWLSDEPVAVNRSGQGQIAATFLCEVGNEQFIVQFNAPNMSTSYYKERMFSDRFAAAGIPVRRVIGTGTFHDLVYTIAEKASGSSFGQLDPQAYQKALPAVFDVLFAIGTVDVSDTTGFGWFDENGRAPYDWWRDHLLQVRDEEPGMFYGDWHDLFETTFLEQDRFDFYAHKLEHILNEIEVPRQLVHGGFGYDNLLVADNEVTVVLDWQDARFGDPLFDLAYMDYWPSGFDLIGVYETYCSERGVVHPNYRRRIQACKIYNGLDSMRYFAKVENREAYNATIAILEKA